MTLSIFVQAVAHPTDWGPYGVAIFGIAVSLIISLIRNPNKKLDDLTENRFEALEDNTISADELSRIRSDVKAALSSIEEIKSDRERRSREIEQQFRQIDQQQYKSDKENTQKLNEISNMLARINPK